LTLPLGGLIATPEFSKSSRYDCAMLQRTRRLVNAFGEIERARPIAQLKSW
jgi:hypothetical protein